MSTHSITHASHPHPLRLVNRQLFSRTPHCSACNLAAATTADTIYACTDCNFALHLQCSRLPEQIRHPLHGRCGPLTLAYGGGRFNCNGCGLSGSGFSYQCVPCVIDLHTTCAVLPTNVTVPSHSHQLALTSFGRGNSFSCSTCRNEGSDTWLYSCAACRFNVHLTCVAAVIIPPPPTPGLGPQPYPDYGPARPVNGPRRRDRFLNMVGSFISNTAARLVSDTICTEVFSGGDGSSQGETEAQGYSDDGEV